MKLQAKKEHTYDYEYVRAKQFEDRQTVDRKSNICIECTVNILRLYSVQ